MEIKMLVEKINQIHMPEEMQEKIIENCYIEMEKKEMNRKTIKNFRMKPIVAIAVMAFCLCITGITAYAATEKLEGFFKDIKKWNGAIVGTSYEQATDEINVQIQKVSEELNLVITMVNPEEAPYSSFETLGIENYTILNSDESVIVEGKTTDMVEIVDSKVMTSISLKNIPSGAYKLVITEFVGGAKAEQPLIISGTWECEFVR